MQPTFPQPGPLPGNQPSALTGRRPGDDRDAAHRAELLRRPVTRSRRLLVGLGALVVALAVWSIVATVLGP